MKPTNAGHDYPGGGNHAPGTKCQLTEEYDRIIDPITGEASDWLELPASLVTQEMVFDGDVDVTNLETVAGNSYNDRSWMPTTSWMTEFLGS